jgi:hypothetical protein
MTNCRHCIYRSICLAMIKPDVCQSCKTEGVIPFGMVGLHPGDKQQKFLFEGEHDQYGTHKASKASSKRFARRQSAITRITSQEA